MDVFISVSGLRKAAALAHVLREHVRDAVKAGVQPLAHGLPEMHVADLGADMNVMQRAQSEAQLLLASDPELSAPEHAALRQSVERMLRVNADSFN